MSDNVIPIDRNESFHVSEVICIKCSKRFICARPAGLLLKQLECYACNEVGYIIETGECIDNVYDEEIVEYTRKPVN